jgi:endonuclease-3
MQDADIAPFFATLRDANPEPASELEYASVFELLVAVCSRRRRPTSASTR